MPITKHLVGCTVALLALASPAHAITNGDPDDGRHPYVGALVTHDGKDRKKRLICSGTLVSPTVFVTAAHCLVDEPENLYVSFDAFVGAPDVGPEVTLHPGRAVGHPEYVDSTAPGDTHDVGLVVLDPPLEGAPVAQLPLPEANEAATAWDLVGYGREGFDGTAFYGGGTRHFATGAFGSLEEFKLLLDQRGTLGGSCNGDSGGPVLLGGTSTLLAVISDGDPECLVDSVNYRLDTASARDFLDDHVAVPEPVVDPVTAGDPGEQPTTTTTTTTTTSTTVGVTAGPRVLSRFRRRVVKRLAVHGLPSGGRVVLRCRGPRGACRFGVRRVSGRSKVDLAKLLGRRRLARGTVLRVSVTAPGRAPQRVRFAVRGGKVQRTALR